MSDMSSELADHTNRIQVQLGDIGRAFKGAVLTHDGCFKAVCPVDPGHNLFIWLDDNGLFAIVCPVCQRQPATAERLTTALRQRLPEVGMGTVPEDEPRPVTAWIRQPRGAPVTALRRMSDHSVQLMAEPGQEAAARSWLEASLQAGNKR